MSLSNNQQSIIDDTILNCQSNLKQGLPPILWNIWMTFGKNLLTYLQLRHYLNTFVRIIFHLNCLVCSSSSSPSDSQSC